MRELELDEAPLAADAVHDLEVVDAARRAALDEAPEPVGLPLEAKLAQGTHGELRVPDPAVAVVPIAFRADGFGEGGGGGRHHRARRCVGEGLEHDR